MYDFARVHRSSTDGQLSIIIWLTVAEAVGDLQSVLGVALLVLTFYVVSLRVSFTLFAVRRALYNNKVMTIDVMVNILTYVYTRAHTCTNIYICSHAHTFVPVLYCYSNIHNKLGMTSVKIEF